MISEQIADKYCRAPRKTMQAECRHVAGRSGKPSHERMRNTVSLPWLLAASAAMAQSPESASTQVPARLTAEECAVWMRELSFARSVAEHDAPAFAEHVAETAIFGSPPRLARGVRRW